MPFYLAQTVLGGSRCSRRCTGLCHCRAITILFTRRACFKARAKHLATQGRNSFTELSLPEAIMRFKQGFGRLIRSSQDKGAFIVLDRRITSKSYGKEFIKALPPIDVKKLQLPELLKELNHWQK